MIKIRVTGNALEFQKIAYNASGHNFVFCDFGAKEFLTATPVHNS